MRVADGIICSTDYLARRYRSLQRAHVGVLQRHRPQALRVAEAGPRGRHDRLGRRRRPQGLAGALGARDPRRAARPPRDALRVRRPRRRRRRSSRSSARERAIAYPTGKIEVYPASMTLFDIAIAPSAENNLFRGKSDLRWLEASALGHPARRAPRRLSRDRGRRHRRARAHARTRSRRRCCGCRRRRAARAHRRARRTSTSPSTAASRSPPRAGARSCSRSRAGGRDVLNEISPTGRSAAADYLG